MLTNDQIYRSLREVALVTKHEFNLEDIHHVESNQRSYDESELIEFKRDLVEAGNKIRVLFLEYQVEEKEFKDFIAKESSPIFGFIREDDRVRPIILIPEKKSYYQIIIGETENKKEKSSLEELNWIRNEKGEIEFYAIFIYQSPLSTAPDGKELSPVKRLLRLLGTERKEIFYILFYAVIIGFVSLILPLGIQSTVELVSGGVVFSSVYLMIGLVIVGVLLTGALQIVQISLVEFLQRRIFSKAAFEFAYRLPRLRMEAILKSYAPEMANPATSARSNYAIAW